MSFRKRTSNQREDGQVLVLFALASVVLVGAIALAVDVGYLLAERREAQAAADAAALATAGDIWLGNSTSTARSSGYAYAANNGVANGVDGASVDIDITGDNRDGEVEVNVSMPVERFFLGAIYTGPWAVDARAVAEIHNDRLGDYGLITLEEPGTKFNGNNSIVIYNGGAMTNDAVNANPSNSHEFVADGAIDSAGGIYNANGNWSAGAGMHDYIAEIDDPIAAGGIAPPSKPAVERTAPSCGGGGGSKGKGKKDDDDAGDDDGCTWLPGLYKNGSTTIPSNTTATFEPGLYYFDNFDLSLQSTKSRIEGDGVMLYFDEDSTFEPKNGEMYITAPDTSPYADGLDGMVFWMANCTTIESRGNTDYYFEGVFYVPCTDLVFRGTPQTPVMNGQMIAGSVEMKGTGNIWIDYNGYLDVPVYEVFLVE